MLRSCESRSRDPVSSRLTPSGIVRCEPIAADDDTAAGSQRFVVSVQRMMPQIVMSVRLPGNAHTTTLRTAKSFHHVRPGCEMEDQRDRQHHVFVRDTTVPSTARMYDYWLGGHDNFAADRAAALKAKRPQPQRPAHGRACLPVPLRPPARPPGHPRTGPAGKVPASLPWRHEAAQPAVKAPPASAR